MQLFCVQPQGPCNSAYILLHSNVESECRISALEAIELCEEIEVTDRQADVKPLPLFVHVAKF